MRDEFTMVTTPARWESRAIQARQLADSMGQDPVRFLLLGIAENYDKAARDQSNAVTSTQIWYRQGRTAFRTAAVQAAASEAVAPAARSLRR
jgi:hypothetical protein